MLQRIFVLVLFGVFLFPAHSASADNPRPTRLPTPLPGGGMVPVWMTPPARGNTQADQGAVIYYYRCMACHGDKGQGLTVEWRAQWDVEHQDCARSTCHGARHPPEGFSFPKNFAPALVGANALTNYPNAQALFDFISTRMPFQAPASLSRQEYWNLVAYLLSRRGVNVRRVDETNARGIALNASSTQPITALSLAAGFVAGVALIGVSLYKMKKK